MIKHLPLTVLKDVAEDKISNYDKKVIDNVQKHNAKVYSMPKNSQLV